VEGRGGLISKRGENEKEGVPSRGPGNDVNLRSECRGKKKQGGPGGGSRGSIFPRAKEEALYRRVSNPQTKGKRRTRGPERLKKKMKTKQKENGSMAYSPRINRGKLHQKKRPWLRSSLKNGAGYEEASRNTDEQK